VAQLVASALGAAELAVSALVGVARSALVEPASSALAERASSALGPGGLALEVSALVELTGWVPARSVLVALTSSALAGVERSALAGVARSVLVELARSLLGVFALKAVALVVRARSALVEVIAVVSSVLVEPP
jgi:hypothetical protein